MAAKVSDWVEFTDAFGRVEELRVVGVTRHYGVVVYECCPMRKCKKSKRKTGGYACLPHHCWIAPSTFRSGGKWHVLGREWRENAGRRAAQGGDGTPVPPGEGDARRPPPGGRVSGSVKEEVNSEDQGWR